MACFLRDCSNSQVLRLLDLAHKHPNQLLLIYDTQNPNGLFVFTQNLSALVKVTFSSLLFKFQVYYLLFNGLILCNEWTICIPVLLVIHGEIYFSSINSISFIYSPHIAMEFIPILYSTGDRFP